MTQIVQLDFSELQAAIKNCLRESIEEIKSIPAPEPLPDRITINEACKITDSSKAQIYKLSMLGEIPASKYGKRLVFSRKVLLEWMAARTISVSPAGDVMSDRLAISAKKHLNK